MTAVSYNIIENAIDSMTPEQFAAYDAALRARDYYAMNPEDQSNYLVAIRAANARRQREFNVTVTDGNRLAPTRASLLPSLPGGLQWTPLLAIGGVLVLVLVLGRKR